MSNLSPIERLNLVGFGPPAPDSPLSQDEWVKRLGTLGSSLPEAARPMFRTMLDLLDQLNAKIDELDKEIARRAREDTIARRLMTIPGVGPITATAIAALAPPAETFSRGRDFAAWLPAAGNSPATTQSNTGPALAPLGASARLR